MKIFVDIHPKLGELKLPKKYLRFLFFAWALTVPLGSTVLSRDFEGFNLDIPDGWSEMDRPDSAVKVLLKSPDGKSVFAANRGAAIRSGQRQGRS